jgi:hypothetical protein
MTTRAIIDADRTIAFDCPKCQLRTKVDLDKVGRTYHCQVQCTCGNIFSADIELRERSRKQLDIPGTYKIIGQEEAGAEALPGDSCRVIDLSRTGLAFLKNAGERIEPGAIVQVSFHLDDAEASEIVQVCEVRHVKENFIGCLLRSENPILNDYLLG